MKCKDAKLAAELCDAIVKLPKVSRALNDKPGKYHECVYLELSAAEMQDGEGQGSNHYFYLPPKIGRAVLDAAKKIIIDELKKLGVQP